MIVASKTGWDGQVCWSVGWVEGEDEVMFIALNMDTPNGIKDLAIRDSIFSEFCKFKILSK